jgi:hypothetical protein
MKKSTRKKLFWATFFVFLCISVIIVLYAQGYRYDFQTNSFQKTGGIFLKISPPNSLVILNGKKSYIASSLTLPLLSASSLFINNLLSKNYSLDISKENYRPLHLELKVDEQKVTAFNHIVLIKKELLLENAIQNVKNLLTDSLSKKIAYFSPQLENVSAKSATSSLIIFDLENGSNVPIDLAPNLPKNVLIFNITPTAWSQNGKNLLFSVDSSLKKYWLVYQEIKGYVLDITTGLQNFETKNLQNFNFDASGDNLYFQYKNNIFELALSKNSSPVKIISDIKTFALNNDYLYFLNSKNQLIQGDFNSKNQILFSEISFKLKNPKLIINSQKTFPDILDEGYNFYVWQKDKKSFEGIVPSAQNVFSSFDGSLYAITSNEYTYIYANKDLDEQPFWKEGFLWAIKNLNGIAPQNLIWFYDNYHLISQSQNNLYLSSVDERGGKQLENILENTPPAGGVEKIFSPEKSSDIYILIKNQIFKINLI